MDVYRRRVSESPEKEDVFCSSDSISSTRNIGRDITIGVLTSGGDAQVLKLFLVDFVKNN